MLMMEVKSNWLGLHAVLTLTSELVYRKVMMDYVVFVHGEVEASLYTVAIPYGG